ncbi:MAG: M24 family metallopeptidase [Xanthomonadales bacterium]|nr:M24 family metallopeptidase [Xanthomonadales bacterium]
MSIIRTSAIAACLLAWGTTQAESTVLSMRERAAVIDRWTNERIQSVLPDLMRRAEIDFWLIISREYNEDPVIKTLLPATWQSARRRTILAVHDPGGEEPLETLAIARYAVGDAFEKTWDKEQEPDQWARLVELIEERDPDTIGINISENFALADGLASTEHRLLLENLPERYHPRLRSAEALAIGWLETRTPSEMEIYPQVVRIAHEIIAEGFSEAVIQPGVTTTDDVAWWYRDRIRERGLTAWFHPSVSIQRADTPTADFIAAFSSGEGENVIRPGDLLHVDFGITYLRLNTDTQQHAYVLRPGEVDAPQELKAALATANRLQDILTAAFKPGRTGNEILAATLSQAEKEGIAAHVYSHPIGYHGHGAGPPIGLWDQQDGVPGRGDYPLYPNTAHSIELNVRSQIDSWGREIRIMLEEDAFFDGETVRYIDGRQTALMLIPRPIENAR